VDQNASLDLSNAVSGADGAILVKGGGGPLQLGGPAAASTKVLGTFASVLGPNGQTQIVLLGGSLNLNQEKLIVSLATGFVLAIGQQFTLVDYPGGDVGGTFAGLADSSTFQEDGLTFRISYGRGNGSQPGNGMVVITRIA
jgi:hypothetical protein